MALGQLLRRREVAQQVGYDIPSAIGKMSAALNTAVKIAMRELIDIRSGQLGRGLSS